MSVAKINPSGDVVDGGSAIQPTPGNVSAFFYAPAARTIDLVDPNAVTFFQHADAIHRGGHWQKDMGSIPASSGDCNQAASGDAVVYYPAIPYQSHTFYGFAWDYSGTPTAGAIQVESPSGSIVWGPMPIQTPGDGFFDFNKGERGVTGADLLIRLIGGGAGIIGSVAVKGHRQE